ncbi:MAG: OsmC family protein [Actinobacteria bacterium]|nr:OsmC family protein [Actinomycetota bacterium]
MAVRKAKAAWEGSLVKGRGTVEVESGLFKSPYSFNTRFGDEKGTNPEELIGAAHAACYSMALSFMLEQNGFIPERVSTEANVSIDKVGDGFKITKILLITRGEVPGIDSETFLKFASDAKVGCPVSQALAATTIELDAALV